MISPVATLAETGAPTAGALAAPSKLTVYVDTLAALRACIGDLSRQAEALVPRIRDLMEAQGLTTVRGAVAVARLSSPQGVKLSYEPMADPPAENPRLVSGTRHAASETTARRPERPVTALSLHWRGYCLTLALNRR